MTDEPTKQPAPDQRAIKQEVGQRLKEASIAFGHHRTSKKIFEDHVAELCHVGERAVKAWTKGDHLPDIYQLHTILNLLDSTERTQDFDANYILQGKQNPLHQESSDLSSVHTKLDRLQKQVEFLAHYTRDHELGVEGVVMRQSMRLLEHLRNTKPTNSSADETQDTEPLVAGVLPDDLMEIPESCATRVRLATLRLDYVVETDSLKDSSQRFRPGRLAPLVADQVNSGCKYEYLVPAVEGGWHREIEEYTKALTACGTTVPRINEQIRFQETTAALGAGFVLIDLDMEKLQHRSYGLAAELEEYVYITKDGSHILGDVMSPSPKFRGSMLMDHKRVEMALSAWSSYMKHSMVIEAKPFISEPTPTK